MSQNGPDCAGRKMRPCKFCDSVYISSSALSKHVRAKHPSALRISTRNNFVAKPSKSLFKLACSPKFLCCKSRSGGPTILLYDFAAAFALVPTHTCQRFTSYPLYSVLYYIHAKQADSVDFTAEHGNCELKNFPAPSSEVEVKAVDQALGEYLKAAGRVVSKECYRRIIRVAVLCRECLEDLQEKLENGVSAMSIPLVANEVVAIVMKYVDLKIMKAEAVGLVLNLCWWMHSNKYTMEFRAIKGLTLLMDSV
eukprot:TRINITY_DN10226_c0_g2_i2.p1 TRINITY_DN10226_c0_g2~~TRINITY_DN10226_c0_g2_i2.p1  ORF type:complete len:252 (+),score=55.99 TRINITY_DN10226_c0_g2_i2:248-1003(+)